ncbi:MAG TPA: hypothetical protein GXX47_03740 [Firmicutes bacterium]|nr:hypothetical protein [Bacillota bacterium]
MTDSQVVQLIASTRQELLKRAGEANKLHVLFGFDAFIDQVSDLVDKRLDFESFTRVETIRGFGQKIMDAAGLSTSLEHVPRYVKIGGSAVSTGLAMGRLGCKFTYIGCIGYPAVNPVFEDFAASAAAYYNIANPGQTLALEFQDGKIMLCNTSPLKEITWDRIVSEVGKDKLKELIQHSRLVATINWTMIPEMNNIWKKLQSEILPEITFDDGELRLFFMDPIDPEKRTGEDWREAMEIFARFSSHYRTILSINRKEATEVAKAYGIKFSVPLNDVGLRDLTEAIADAMDLYGVVVHPVDGAGAVIDGEYYYAPGPYTSKPLLTTSGGDNFNGGFCLGLLLGLAPQQALVVGAATSGYFVRTGRSPSWDQLVSFLACWERHAGEDFSDYE